LPICTASDHCLGSFSSRMPRWQSLCCHMSVLLPVSSFRSVRVPQSQYCLTIADFASFLLLWSAPVRWQFQTLTHMYTSLLLTQSLHQCEWCKILVRDRGQSSFFCSTPIHSKEWFALLRTTDHSPLLRSHPFRSTYWCNPLLSVNRSVKSHYYNADHTSQTWKERKSYVQ
jgi:hypothetical protein